MQFVILMLILNHRRDGSMAVDDMEACGVYPDKAEKDLSRGIPRVKEALRRKMPRWNSMAQLWSEFT